MISEYPIARAIEVTKGRGVDLMIDQVVGPNFADNLKMMAPLGMIVTINALGGSPTKNLFDSLRATMDRSVAVRPFSVHVYDGHDNERVRISDNVLKLFASDSVTPAINTRLPLADARKAHELMDQGAILGELVLKP